MTDGVELKLIGDRDLIAALKDLKQFLSKNALRKAVRKGALILLESVKQRAPNRTGKLLRNIGLKFKVTAKTLRARVTVNKKGKAEDPKNAFYFRFLEKGFTTRGGEKRIFPFVEPAVRAVQQQAAQQVIDEVGKAIKRAEAKQRRAARASRR